MFVESLRENFRTRLLLVVVPPACFAMTNLNYCSYSFSRIHMHALSSSTAAIHTYAFLAFIDVYL
jgi:hypothetical protein